MKGLLRKLFIGTLLTVTVAMPLSVVSIPYEVRAEENYDGENPYEEGTEEWERWEEEKRKKKEEEERLRREEEDRKKSFKKYVEEKEKGKANGTAGEEFSSVKMNGVNVVSSVPGCYWVPAIGGVAVTSDKGAVENAVSLKYGEIAQAYIYTSHCSQLTSNYIAASALQNQYPLGTLVDIRIGKRTATSNFDYSTPFPLGSKGVNVALTIPSGYFVVPGYEVAFYCLNNAGMFRMCPNMGNAPGVCQINVKDPSGIYMMTQIPQATANQLRVQELTGDPNQQMMLMNALQLQQAQQAQAVAAMQAAQAAALQQAQAQAIQQAQAAALQQAQQAQAVAAMQAALQAQAQAIQQAQAAALQALTVVK